MITSYEILQDGSVAYHEDADGVVTCMIDAEDADALAKRLDTIFTGYTFRYQPMFPEMGRIRIGCKVVDDQLARQFVNEYLAGEWKKLKETPLKPGDYVGHKHSNNKFRLISQTKHRIHLLNEMTMDVTATFSVANADNFTLEELHRAGMNGGYIKKTS